MKRLVFLTLALIFLFSLLSCNNKQETAPVDLVPFEKYCKEFFNINKEYNDFSDTIIQRIKEFMAINEGTKEFSGKVPFKIIPIYSYGIEGVAYYEIWFTIDGRNPKGWILLSRTDKDFPLVNFSHEGIPYSKKVTDQAQIQGITIDSSFKMYRFGVSYFTLENKIGEKIAEFGEMPSFLPKDIDKSNGGKGDSKTKTYSEKIKEDTLKLLEGVHYNSIGNYYDLKKYFPESYFNQRRAKYSKDMLQRIFPKNKHGEAYLFLKSADQYIYRWVSGTQCLYTQISANTSFNYTGCWSGCNNNAWTSLFGWWDLNQSKKNLIATTSTGEACPTIRNTMERRDVVDPVQMWFRGKCGTYCESGGGWTLWKNAWKGYEWAANEGYGWSYWYQWCNNAGCDVDLADILVDCIGNNLRPAHVGANSHFYVGTGFAQWSSNTDWTWVYCYPGWSENHNDDVWIYWRDLNASTKVFVY
jgi:hypothetical protein